MSGASPGVRSMPLRGGAAVRATAPETVLPPFALAAAATAATPLLCEFCDVSTPAAVRCCGGREALCLQHFVLNGHLAHKDYAAISGAGPELAAQMANFRESVAAAAEEVRRDLAVAAVAAAAAATDHAKSAGAPAAAAAAAPAPAPTPAVRAAAVEAVSATAAAAAVATPAGAAGATVGRASPRSPTDGAGAGARLAPLFVAVPRRKKAKRAREAKDAVVDLTLDDSDGGGGGGGGGGGRGGGGGGQAAAPAAAATSPPRAADHKARASFVNMLAAALFERCGSAEPRRKDARGVARELAEAVERQLFRRHNRRPEAAAAAAAAAAAPVPTAKYRKQAKEIVFAAKDANNRAFAAGIWDGRLGAEAVATMAPAAMLSKRQAQAQEYEEASLVPSMTAAAGDLTEGEHRCEQCDSRRVHVLTLVNPADCRKQEIWGSSTAEAWEYGMTCADCHHQWNA